MGKESFTVFIDNDLADLIPVFLERRQSDLEKLRGHLANRSFEDLRVMGHTLKGSAGGYGFDGLSKIGADIETAATQADEQGILANVQAMEQYLDSLVVEFR